MCARPRTTPSRCECRDACGPARVGGGIHATDVGARGLEASARTGTCISHVLGRALWHALALTDASPRAPQVCSTSREDKRTGFTVPPQTTRDLSIRERETGRGKVKHEGRGRGRNGGARGKVYSKPTRGAATSDDDDKYCSPSEANGAICLEEGTYLGDTRQETHYEDIDTVLKRPFFYPALPFLIWPCAPHLPPLFCQSWSLALSLPSAIARAPLS